ncbi:MAG: NAD(P)/FAD-dependent oxidoreductase [Gammaproteobacteria bacterium]|nr:NAD(P)/FAD-dependent oxidoreductase [Gammaproteobacteria bacterium]
MVSEVEPANAGVNNVREYDAVVIGAGFAGLYMLHRLRNLGLKVRAFEAGSGPGGTWYWNRYPGARCDVVSMEYSYQFSSELQQEWEWSERYATQPEILRYVNHVADRFDLRRDIQFNTKLLAAHYDEASSRWDLQLNSGEAVSARFCVMATGCLSSANLPRIPGLESFTGVTYHTGHWPHEGVDFTDKTVGLIGTGSSAIQSIPLIAQQARHLTIFQRTASYSIPARNAPLEPTFVREIKQHYDEYRANNWRQPFGVDFRQNETPALKVSDEVRTAEYEARWQEGKLGFLAAFGDILIDKSANETAAEFIREKIRAIVQDPGVAAKLLPRQIVGCKRLCLDTGYYETFNRANVSLVEVSASPITAVTPLGLRSEEQDYEFECLVFATGFDAMTGALDKIDIRGSAGQRLKDKWAAGPRTYLGLASAGFPNLFTISGPGSPSVLSNMLPTIEQHVNWITDCIAYVLAQGAREIDATVPAEDEWVEHVNQVAHTTLYPNCSSWYLGANIPGKARIFMPYIGVPPYVEKCSQVAAKGYAGFAISR